MRRSDFCEYVEKEDAVTLMAPQDSLEPSADVVYLRNEVTRRTYRLSVPLLSDLELHELDAVVSGRREPASIITLTRIVGYYSQTVNWNRSKLGELEDRRKGDYAVEPQEPPVRPAEVTPVHAAG